MEIEKEMKKWTIMQGAGPCAALPRPSSACVQVLLRHHPHGQDACVSGTMGSQAQPEAAPGSRALLGWWLGVWGLVA